METVSNLERKKGLDCILPVKYELSIGEKDELKSYYLKYHENDIQALTYTDFSEYFRTGKRLAFEEKYFNRRRRLNSAFMMSMVFGDGYLEELCELLRSVCDEFTWALPAHTENTSTAYKTVDLFNAETALCLTEIVYLAKDKLPKALVERIRNEIDRRVIIPYENEAFSWEIAAHNWAAVCGGCIGMIYLYNNKPVPERIFRTMECYLSGFKPDGVCLEGLNYWSYGFGYFMYFADLLLKKTGKNIATDEKILSAARFQQHMYLGREAVSCSDSRADVMPLMGLANLLARFFGEDNIYAPPVNFTRNDDCGRWAHYIRSYMRGGNLKCANRFEILYPYSQWYIKRGEKFGIFIKGGNNSEPHNHNDVGSFILSDDNGQILCDIGCGEYQKGYFDEETRYNNLCCSSKGHSVPIIDGEGQLAGEKYQCRSFSRADNEICLEIGAAYGDGIKIQRNFRLAENGVVLKDKFSFADTGEHDVKERFISRICPRTYKGETVIGRLRINKEGKISTETISDHYGEKIEVYMIDFNVSDNYFEVSFEL